MCFKMATSDKDPEPSTFSGPPASTTIRLDTKGFCIFCLKRGDLPPVTSEDGTRECKVDVGQLEAAQLRQKFSRVISRYLGTKFTFLNSQQPAENPDNEDKDGFLNKRFQVVPDVDVSVICKDCSILVENICHFFHEIKKLEIALDWNARQLKSIMAFAKRAPTRVKIFRAQYSDSGTPADMQALERVEMFRKDFLEKCSKKFRKVQPRIIFNRRGDPSSKSSPRKAAKKLVQNVTFHDAEVQTEPFSNGDDRPLKSQNNNTSKKTKRLLNNNGRDSASQDCRVENNRNSASPSPPPLSPANSGGLSVTQDDEEEDSQCFIKIRTIESLASPTKSVSEESPVRRTTRSSTRISPATNSGSTLGNKIVGVALRNDDDKSQSTTKRANGPVLKSVPDILASLSAAPTPSPSSATTVQINDLRSRKATLAEWLQSTFNCDKCNKMFISEATLSVHKTTCGVDTRQTEESGHQDLNNESMELDDSDNGESPMDVSQAEDSSEDEQEDPLGEATEDPKQAQEDATDAEKPTNKTFTTIRILTNNTAAPSITQSSHSDTRYCKYCKGRYSKNHFTRHRQTLKHKQNKRIHKKAKKMGTLSNPTTNTSSMPVNSKTPTNISASAAASANAIVTVGREENNVKVVKIIYLTKNGSTAESREISSSSVNQKETSKNGESEKRNENAQSDVGVSNEVIDISD